MLLSSMPTWITWKHLMLGFAWSVGCVLAWLNGIGNLAVIATTFTFIYFNLGEREPGTLSAYSVFNKDFKELDGTLNASQFERELLHQSSEVVDEDDDMIEHDVQNNNDDEMNQDEWEDEEERQFQLALERSRMHTSGASPPRKTNTQKRHGKKKGRKIR